MLRQIKRFTRFLGRLLTFARPAFVYLRYEPIMIGGKAYLLISWQHRRAYRLRIKALHFKSYQLKGSAYIALRAGTTRVKVRISNSWRSYSQQMVLVEAKLTRIVDYFPEKKFDDLRMVQVSRPLIQSIRLKPTVRPGARIAGRVFFQFTLKNIS